MLLQLYAYSLYSNEYKENDNFNQINFVRNKTGYKYLNE